MKEIPFEFHGISRSKKFKRDYKKLDSKSQQLVDEALHELVGGSVKESRNLKKRKPKRRGIFQIYVTKSGLRLTFKQSEGALLLLRVADHRTIETIDR